MHRLFGVLIIWSLMFIVVRAQDTVFVVEPDSILFVSEVEEHPDTELDVNVNPLKFISREAIFYDSLSYQQYLKNDYKKIISTTKEASERNIDFIYKNSRTAFAYYQLKNYAKSAVYYEKAIVDLPDDMELKKGLYYAYLMSGQKANADILAKTLPQEVQTEIAYSPTIINSISFSGGYVVNDNKENIRANIAELDSINQYQDMVLGGITLGFNLSDRVKMNTGYSLFNTNFERYNQTGLLNNEILSQHQFNLGMDFYLKGNVSFGLVGGYYAIEKNNKTASQTASSGGNGFGFGGGQNSSITAVDNFYKNFSGLVYLNKRFTYVIPEIAVAFSNFADVQHFQTKFQLTYYPLGNLNFYGISSGAIIVNNNDEKTKQTVVSQNIGLRLFGNFWLDGMVSYGNHLNYITDRSFVVYDTYDPVKAMAGASLSYFYKKFSVSATYKWMQKEGWLLSGPNYVLSNYLYNNQLVNLVLQWNF